MCPPGKYMIFLQKRKQKKIELLARPVLLQVIQKLRPRVIKRQVHPGQFRGRSWLFIKLLPPEIRVMVSPSLMATIFQTQGGKTETKRQSPLSGIFFGGNLIFKKGGYYCHKRKGKVLLFNFWHFQDRWIKHKNIGWKINQIDSSHFSPGPLLIHGVKNPTSVRFVIKVYWAIQTTSNIFGSPIYRN